jgi:hypothetical protein
VGDETHQIDNSITVSNRKSGMSAYQQQAVLYLDMAATQ